MTQAVGSCSRLWSGLILTTLGVLFLLDRLSIIRFGEFLGTWWPSILIAIGLVQLAVGRPRRKGGALFLIALGVLFQVDTLNVFPWWSAGTVWPVLLIVAGVWLLLGRARPPAIAVASRVKEESGEIVDALVIWGGLERAVTSKQFRGGEATALMGGIELDLRRAELAPGEQQLKLTALMGGIQVRVPENWQVTVEGTPLMGAIEDSRKPSASAPFGAGALASVPDAPTGGRLLVRGFALMGGIEVKS